MGNLVIPCRESLNFPPSIAVCPNQKVQNSETDSSYLTRRSSCAQLGFSYNKHVQTMGCAIKAERVCWLVVLYVLHGLSSPSLGCPLSAPTQSTHTNPTVDNPPPRLDPPVGSWWDKHPCTSAQK